MKQRQLKSAVCAACAAVALAGLADGVWTGAGADTLVSNPLNWAGETVPDGKLTFGAAAAGQTVFFDRSFADTALVVESDALTDQTQPLVWTATDAGFGCSGASSLKIRNAWLKIQKGSFKASRYAYDSSHYAFIGRSGTKGRLDIEGGATDFVIVWVSNGEGSEGTVNVSGGSLSAAALSVAGGVNTKGRMSVTGGQVECYNEGLNIAEEADAVGEMTISGGKVKAGTVNLARTAGSSATLRVVDEGVLAVHTISFYDRGGSAETATALLLVDGGTLMPRGDYSDWLGNAVVTVGPKGCVLDTDGKSDTITATFVSDGEHPVILHKKGAGTLTFTEAALANVEKIVVDGGNLVFPEGCAHYPVVMFADGASPDLTYGDELSEVNKNLLVSASGIKVIVPDAAVEAALAAEEPLTLAGLTFADGVNPAEVVFFAHKAYDFTVEAGADGVLRATPVRSAANRNVWIGGADGQWAEAANWSLGRLPEAGDIVEFMDNATVRTGGEAKKDQPYAALRIDAGKRVRIKTTNFWTLYPTLRVNAVEGRGTIAFYQAGIEAMQDLTIPATITLEALHAEELNNLHDNWFSGKGGRLTISSKIIGDGLLKLYGNITLAGDNSGFAGTVEQQWGDWAWPKLIFVRPEAGSARARWKFNDDVRMEFDEGTIQFGALDTNGNSGYTPGIYRHSGATFTIEVGARNEDFTFGSYERWSNNDYNDYNNPIPLMTVRKVGSGTLHNYAYGLRQIVVEEGEVEFHESKGDRHYGSGQKIFQIDSLVVKDGATISGMTTQPIYAATFEPGAQLKVTLTDEGAVEPVQNYACDLDVSGLRIVAEAADGDLTVARKGLKYKTLLTTSGALTGLPTWATELPKRTASTTWPFSAQTASGTASLCFREYIPHLIIAIR